MYLKLLKNDFKKNPWNNAILFLLMSLSVMLAVSVCLILVLLFTSISTMYETAKPPHFLQMHKGELSQEAIDEFNGSYPDIVHWQTVPMIDVYGEELTITANDTGSSETAANQGEKAYTLEDCRLDISLVKQNESYDVLLDENRNKLIMSPGKIGVPVILLEQYSMQKGDIITLKSGNVEKSFEIAAYVYDGQMNSTLCSSTRFLLSDENFDELFGTVGETEYLIEAYFADSGAAAAYQTAYEQSKKDLPKNGQAVTYPILFLLSAMTDILTAMVILLTGVLLIAIALLCLRYSILAKVEEEQKEIGTMKALGIPGKGIRGLYLGEIRILMTAGCISGFLLALPSVRVLSGHISRTFGRQQYSLTLLLPAVLTCMAVYGIVLAFSGRVLGRLRKATIADLLITEKGFGRNKTAAKDGIHKCRMISVNWLLGFWEVRHGYGLIFGLLLIVTFLMVVPCRMVQTLEHEEFITYMGSSVCDLLLEVEQGAGLEERRTEAEKQLQSERNQGYISGFEEMKRVRLQAQGADKELTGIHIDTGKNAGKGLKYLTGSAPETEYEIALSCLMAEELEKTTGNTLTLLAEGKAQEFLVSGIYQDVTSGGRTAKAIRNFDGEPAEQYSFQVMLTQESGQTAEEDIADRLRENLGSGYSIENMEEFVAQTLGGVTGQVRQGAVCAMLIGIALTILIVLLFLKLRMAREVAALSAKRAMGIPLGAMVRQELYPIMIAGGLGALFGELLAEYLGDDLISLFFGALGIGLKRIVFAPFDFWLLGIPAVLLITLMTVCSLACRELRQIRVAEHCNE